MYISYIDGYVLFCVKNVGIEYKLGALSPHFIKNTEVTKCDHSLQVFTDDISEQPQGFGRNHSLGVPAVGAWFDW